jgi:hypothetical protein
MSVAIPKIYVTIETDGGTLNATGEAIHTKFTKPVTASIGDFQLRIAHGSGSKFGKYSDANVFKNVSIWLGSVTTGSSKLFSGKIDTFKSEFDPSGGYIVNFTGRDLGEALFRHQISKNYYGYNSFYPSPRRGCDSGSYDVYSLENYTGSATDSSTTITVGTHASGSLFHVKSYAEINDSFGTSLPGLYGTGSITTTPITATGSDFEINLKLINGSAFAHSGKMYAQLFICDDTGSMTNPVALSSWYGGTVIDFPAGGNFVATDTILINLPYFAVENKFLYLQMVWKVTTAGTDATSGVKVEWAQSSYLNIPADTGLATNVVVSILSGSGINTGSNFPWNDEPLTQSYNKKKAFDAIREISDIVNWDFNVDVTGSLQAWTRRTHTNNGLLQTGSNIFRFAHLKDVDAVFNSITVLGAAESMVPFDGDWWTEGSGSGWVATSGSITESYTKISLGSKVGARYLNVEPDSGWVVIGHPISPIQDVEGAELHFYMANTYDGPGNIAIKQVRLKGAQDSESYFYSNIKDTGTPSNVWGADNSYSLGPDNITGSVKAGDWVKKGQPTWNIGYVEFYMQCGIDVSDVFIEGLRIGPLRWSGSAIDVTSTGSYGLRPYEEESDYFHSNTECQDRADYLLARMKDPPNQYQILTTGSEGINAGDRIYLLLPSEGVTSQTYYDVIEIEHEFTAPDGFTTELMLSDSQYIRDVSLLKSYGVLRAFASKDIDVALRGDKRW